MSDKRINWIDNVKGVAIVAIVLGHAMNGYGLWHWLYGFHVPLFIIVSGMLFKTKPLNRFFETVKKKFFSLMIPYYIFSAISIPLYFVLSSKVSDINQLSLAQCIYGMLWANSETGVMKWNLPLWYLPMSFIMQITAFVLIKKDDNKKLTIYLIVSLIVSTLLYYSDTITNLPFGIETAVYLFPFFIVGKLIHNNIEFFSELSNKKAYLFSLILITAGSIIILLQKNVDYVSDEYRVYFLFFIAALCVSLGIIVIFFKADIKANLLSYTGTKTLAILLMHKFPLLFFEFICPGTKQLYSAHRTIASILITIPSILLCLIVEAIITKYCPWIFGRYKK
jgi:fucose 4-O-acetylase-like acetyltransferase